MFDIMTAKKVSFGLTNANAEKAMQNLAKILVKGETDLHEICKECYNTRESATDAKINDMPWAKFIELQFGSKLKSASAMKYATVYGVFGTPDSGLLHEMWTAYTVSKLQEIATLDGKKHKDAGRSIEKFLQYIGERKNKEVATPYLQWCDSNKAQLDIISTLPEAQQKIMLATLPPAPPAPIADDDEHRAEKLQAMGFELLKSWNNGAVREAVAAYIDENLNTPERKAKQEKAEKAEKAKTAKTAAQLCEEAENALTAFLATLDKKPSELSQAVIVLHAMNMKEGEEE